MRLGLDTFPALTHAPGVGRYARELARAVAELPDGPELRRLELGRGSAVLPVSALGAAANSACLRLPVPARFGAALAAVGLSGDRLIGGVDVFHQVRLHGPIVRHVPQTYAVSEWCAPGREEQFARSLARFDGLLVFSEHYRERLVERLGWSREKLHLVPVGADHWRRDLAASAAPSQAPRSHARVLVLGAPLPGREHVAILEACERLHAGGLELHLDFASTRVDESHALFERVKRSPLGARVRWWAPREAELPVLVAGSQLLVHLANDEGTAVTPAEAVVLGVGVLLSPLPAFCETLDGIADWYAPGEDLPAAIERALARPIDAAARAALARRLTWRANAKASVRAWREVLVAR